MLSYLMFQLSLDPTLVTLTHSQFGPIRNESISSTNLVNWASLSCTAFSLYLALCISFCVCRSISYLSVDAFMHFSTFVFSFLPYYQFSSLSIFSTYLSLNDLFPFHMPVSTSCLYLLSILSTSILNFYHYLSIDLYVILFSFVCLYLHSVCIFCQFFPPVFTIFIPIFVSIIK